jgi:hypothetical protein
VIPFGDLGELSEYIEKELGCENITRVEREVGVFVKFQAHANCQLQLEHMIDAQTFESCTGIRWTINGAETLQQLNETRQHQRRDLVTAKKYIRDTIIECAF